MDISRVVFEGEFPVLWFEVATLLISREAVRENTCALSSVIFTNGVIIYSNIVVKRNSRIVI